MVAKKHWQRELPQHVIVSFRTMYAALVEVPRETSGLLLSKGLFPFLKIPQKRGISYPLPGASRHAIEQKRLWLRKNRSRYDKLHVIFRRWGVAERYGPRYVHYKYKGEHLWSQRSDLISKYRLMTWQAVKEITALVATRHTAQEMAILASMGDDASLFELVRLDKLFLTARFTQRRIRQAQAMEDSTFFQGLSEALLHDSYREHREVTWLGIACYLLWYLGFEKLPKKELFAFLCSEGRMPYTDPGSFSRMLTRIGLTRYKRGKK